MGRSDASHAFHPRISKSPSQRYVLYSTITYHLPKSGQKSNTKNEKAIISAIRSNPAISITEMCPITGLSRSGVQKIIIRLRQQGLIQRVGPAKGGYWEIIEWGAKEVLSFWANAKGQPSLDGCPFLFAIKNTKSGKRSVAPCGIVWHRWLSAR